VVCNSCGNQAAYRISYSAAGECCDRCGKVGSATFHDVHFTQPYLDPHLVDPKKPGQKDGVWITSRSHKARIMRELNLREAGDRVRGSRNIDPSLVRAARQQLGGS
jgi:hypothetical protein